MSNNNNEDFGVEINSEVYDKDYDDVGFDPIEINKEEDNIYEKPED